MRKSLSDIKDIYKEIAEEEKKLCEDFMSISIETIKNEPNNIVYLERMRKELIAE